MATEKRLIDANALAENWFYTNDTGTKVVELLEIEQAPTVDAVEVVHGHWVEWWPGDCALIMTGEEMLYQCSACTAKFSDVEGFQYCPHCGALMEGINHAESDDQA